jgi:Tfp pilus assembly protein PilN
MPGESTGDIPMINLLPPDLKESYRYAQRNVRLVRWVIAFGFSFVGLGVLSTAGMIYMQQSAQSYGKQIATTQALLQEQKLSETQARVKDITSSLRLSVQVLSKEVLFSKLLKQLATVTPNNAVLTDLSINQGQGAVDITALTTDYNAATQLQVNLADSRNKIFSHADIVSISCSSSTTSNQTDAHYPCTVVIRALFVANNPFLFINDSGS